MTGDEDEMRDGDKYYHSLDSLIAAAVVTTAAAAADAAIAITEATVLTAAVACY